MSAKTRLQHSLLHVLKHDHAGSFASRHDRKSVLHHFAEELVKLGYRIPSIQNLKQKHIIAMVKHWKQCGLATSTLKNRLSILRHLARVLGKPSLVPSNTALSIGKRQYVSKINRALHQPDFSQVIHPYIRISLELQRVFGLRREESLKIKPHLADHGNTLELLSSWCKGGRARSVPIQTAEQRYWLDEAKTLAGEFGNSLIPIGKSYIQHRWVYDKQIAAAQLKNPHGLRYAYAQRRYRELTGWEAPMNGGPTAKELTPVQKESDRRARMILSESLGHSRLAIMKNYLG